VLLLARFVRDVLLLARFVRDVLLLARFVRDVLFSCGVVGQVQFHAPGRWWFRPNFYLPLMFFLDREIT